MHSKKNHAIDFKLIVQEKNVIMYANACSLGEFDEKVNYMKISKKLKLWKKWLQEGEKNLIIWLIFYIH